jgi:hypothetical protein
MVGRRKDWSNLGGATRRWASEWGMGKVLFLTGFAGSVGVSVLSVGLMVLFVSKVKEGKIEERDGVQKLIPKYVKFGVRAVI